MSVLEYIRKEKEVRKAIEIGFINNSWLNKGCNNSSLDSRAYFRLKESFLRVVRYD